jgi:hypothetical protein
VSGRCQCAARVPTGKTLPRGLPRVGLGAPDPARPGRVLARFCSLLPRGLLLRRARREGSRETPGNSNSARRAPAAAARPPAAAAAECERVEANLPPRPPLSMPSAAVGEPSALARGKEQPLGAAARPGLQSAGNERRKGRGAGPERGTQEKPVSVCKAVRVSRLVEVCRLTKMSRFGEPLCKTVLGRTARKHLFS